MSILETHINTTEVSLFDTGVGQEGIDESHIHSNTLKNLHVAIVNLFVPTDL